MNLGTASVTVTADDSNGGTVSDTFDIEVKVTEPRAGLLVGNLGIGTASTNLPGL